MAENYVYQCSHCRKKFNTSGPWEFYRNKKGDRIPYGHPGPLTEEARLSGIHGLFANMLCLDCGNEVEVILEEYYKRPEGFIESLKNIWKKEEDQLKCPNCKGKNLFLALDELKDIYMEEKSKAIDTNINCPKCNKGELKMIDHWKP